MVRESEGRYDVNAGRVSECVFDGVLWTTCASRARHVIRW